MTTKFDKLSKKHEAIRQSIIAAEGEISPFKEYPELDAVAHEMFMILSGGKNYITISVENIISAAEYQAAGKAQ
jgi:hypothetical protein